MTKLENISFLKQDSVRKPSIRIDWENDRHNLIELQNLDADSIKQGLLDAVDLIAREQRAGHL